MKKKINNQIWLNLFPDLKAFHENKLIKILGPTVVGIELVPLPRVPKYRPYFVVYSLFGEDLKSSLSGPSILIPLKNERGSDINITINDDSEQSLLSLTDFITMPLPLGKDVLLSQFLEMVKDYSQSPPLSVAPNSFLQAKLREFGLKVILYVGNHTLAKSYLSDLEMQEWDDDHFKLCGTSVDQWLKDVKISYKNSLEETNKANRNRDNDRLKLLNRSEILK
jgi:hypothetical protein